MRQGSSWRALAALIGVLPWGTLRRAGSMIGVLAGRVLRIRRAHVCDAMRAAGLTAPDRIATAMYRSLATSALEFLWLASRGSAALGHAALDPASRAAWQAARRQGHGVVIAASHTGNWDLAACALARETELLVVTKRLSNASLDSFWQSTRAGQGVELASGHGAFARAHEVLRRGGAVAMMIDQVPPTARDASPVRFLGRLAWADRAPAALAARSNAPLVVAGCRRRPDGEHVLHVLSVVEPPPRAGRAWVEHATRLATAALDDFVRAHPSQWLWLHRRWNAPPPTDRIRKAQAPEVDRPRGGTTIAA